MNTIDNTLCSDNAAHVLAPFDRTSDGCKRSIAYILENAPILHLTAEEVVSTLRLIRVHAYLADKQYNDVYVHNNDRRLQQCDDVDRFLALILECEQRDQLLGTKRCRLRFGGTPYHWRKVAKDTHIVVASSAVSEDGGYYGRGWELAPHIVSLRKWIHATTENPDIKRLKI